jgi:hypothetical protein
MLHLQTVYTDSYHVVCPHNFPHDCKVPLIVQVVRERGGKVLDIRVLHEAQLPMERRTDNSE